MIIDVEYLLKCLLAFYISFLELLFVVYMYVRTHTCAHTHTDSHALIAEAVVHDNTCCFTYEVP